MIRSIKDTPTHKKRRFKIPIIRLAFVTVIIIIVFLIIDFTGPSSIYLKPKTFFGMSCLHAKDLVVQEYDNSGNLWATRGMIIYKLEKGSNKFTKVAHVPTGKTVYWLRNFKVIRRLTIRPVCVEMVVTDKGDICAFSAGRIWLLKEDKTRFNEIFQISNYGYGNRGIMPAGLIEINDSTVFFGEYFGNPNKKEVHIFKSVNNFKSFEKAYEFKPSEIRHIHAIQEDPYANILWVCTGDEDEESMLAWSNDGFKSINRLGHGSQLWRACQLVFTEDDIYWGTDTHSEAMAGIYRWSKDSSTIEKLQKIEGAILFNTRLANGTIVMSTDREGMSNEIDLKTRLFVISTDNNVASIDCGTWNRYNTVFGSPFAKMRFQRNQDGPSLVITCLNQKEIRDGDLIIISEDTLVEAAKNRLKNMNFE